MAVGYLRENTHGFTAVPHIIVGVRTLMRNTLDPTRRLAEMERDIKTLSDRHVLASDKIRVYERVLHLFSDPYNPRNFEELMDVTMEVTRCEAGSRRPSVS